MIFMSETIKVLSKKQEVPVFFLSVAYAFLAQLPILYFMSEVQGLLATEYLPMIGLVYFFAIVTLAVSQYLATRYFSTRPKNLQKSLVDVMFNASILIILVYFILYFGIFTYFLEDVEWFKSFNLKIELHKFFLRQVGASLGTFLFSIFLYSLEES